MDRLLLVVHAETGDRAHTDALLRSVRRLGGGHAGAIVLLCDLPASDTVFRLEDDAQIRALQSGIMSMDRHGGGHYMLLVREREWDDAARAYLGMDQKRSVFETIAQLLRCGRTDAAFRAASVSPSSLKDCCEAVLFMDADMQCTPDMPRRMADALALSGGDCVSARVLPRRAADEPLLARLERLGFSLSPLEAARGTLFLRKSSAMQDCAVMVSAAALIAAPMQDMPCKAAPDCVFIRQTPPLDSLLHSFRMHCMRKTDVSAVLPFGQIALIVLSAATGNAWPIIPAVLLPELAAIIKLRLLPGSLVRTSLMPLLFAAALDGLARKLLAGSPRFRIELPSAAFSPAVCTACGGALLISALLSAHALVPLMAISLLWLAAPLIVHALRAPVRERIPLSAQEHERFLALAEDAFAQLPLTAPPALSALAACAGCMLSLLEPDEAARRVQRQLSRMKGKTLSFAHEQAALLACAQYLRERIGDCDAALRELPAQLEAFVSAQPLAQEDGLLAAFLCAARSRNSSVQALSALRSAQKGLPQDLLLLPLDRPAVLANDDPVLPLTHPHSYLLDGKDASGDPLLHFLFLSAAALSHPFWPLLLRSPVTGPYAPLFSISQSIKHIKKDGASRPD